MYRSLYLLLFLLFTTQITQSFSQAFPESLNITGLPSQNQTIYSGWIVADSSTDSLLYYNLYSKDGTDANSTLYNESPFIIYIEGGPGSPAILTAFSEMGPYIANGSFENITMIPNPNSWTKSYHVLFIDNPIGTGFSILRNNYSASSADQTADSLITFFIRFFELYPTIINNPIYIYGRSYGCKWASILTYKWLHNERLQEIPLAGLIIASGIIDPLSQSTYSESAFSFGVVDYKQRDQLKQFELEFAEYVRNGDFPKAAGIWTNLQTYMQDPNVTGGLFFYNYAYYVSPSINFPVEYLRLVYAFLFLSDPKLEYRAAFQIPNNLNFSQASDQVTVPLHQSGDLANSTAYALEYILDQGIQTLIYAGQFDSAVNYVGIMNAVHALNWHGKSELYNAPKKFLHANGTMAGAYLKYENLNLAVVNKAGHFATYDQPQAVFALLEKFLNNDL